MRHGEVSSGGGESSLMQGTTHMIYFLHVILEWETKPWTRQYQIIKKRKRGSLDVEI